MLKRKSKKPTRRLDFLSGLRNIYMLFLCKLILSRNPAKTAHSSPITYAVEWTLLWEVEPSHDIWHWNGKEFIIPVREWSLLKLISWMLLFGHWDYWLMDLDYSDFLKSGIVREIKISSKLKQDWEIACREFETASSVQKLLRIFNYLYFVRCWS